MRQVRLGVIGVGSMGYNHARVCAEAPEIELVAVIDRDAERARFVADKFHTQCVTSLEDLIGKVDAVSIVSPTDTHYDLTKYFLERDVHVLVEKPITVEAAEGHELVEIAKKRNLILQVGHLERFNPAVQKLQGIIKEPVLVECHRLSAKTDRNLDVGVSWDLMIHDYDILLSMLRDTVSDINAMGTSVYSDFEDVALVQLRFAGGPIATLTASRNSSERTRGLKVTEADGRVLWLDFINQSLSFSVLGEDGRPMPTEPIPVEKEEPLKSELVHFIKCIQEHKVPLVSGEDGVKALELAMRVRDKMQFVQRPR